MKLFTAFENRGDGVLRAKIFSRDHGKRKTLASIAFVPDNPDVLQLLLQAAGVMVESIPHLAPLPGGVS